LKNPEKVVIPNPGDFCRGEESAFSLAFCKMQIPRFARDDIQKQFFNKLLRIRFNSCLVRAGACSQPFAAAISAS
jgi:hypothetical protein